VTAPARTVFIGLDACDLDLAQGFASDGAMPTLAGLLDNAAHIETLGPLGFLVGANWATLYSGTTPSRHQFLCSGQIKGETYEPRWIGPVTEPPPVWQFVSRAGGRVAVLDAPHAAVQELNGVQLAEWGCHDRHAGTRSYPAAFLDEINDTYGPHPVGTQPTPFPHYAPCDIVHRAGVHRTRGENRALLADLLEGHRRKAALSRDLLDRGDWDLFFTALGESHCGGHQFWKVHDPTHPWHDGAERAELGDPVRTIYGALDATVGELIERADGATVYVHLTHGMRAHYDGTVLLEPVLWRLDQYASRHFERGLLGRATALAAEVIPVSQRSRAATAAVALRRRAGRIPPLGPPTDAHIPPWLGQRRWWMQPNDSVYGSVRLNVEGREPNGRIAASRRRDAALWLGDRLRELVNVDTGEAAVASVFLTDDHYERTPGDPMGDLIVEWNRDAPIDRVWSPATGLVNGAYDMWRTGDHHRRGLLLAVGGGIAPGRRAGTMPVVDVGPTLAASLDLDVPSFDGVARDDLLPGAHTATRMRPASPPGTGRRERAPRRWSTQKMDADPHAWIEKYAIGLSQSIHVLHLTTGELQREVERLRQVASITEVGAWLRMLDVPESLLVSVVMPTRNREDRLERSIASVRAQSYAHWELLVVDDASTDDTWTRLTALAEDDARIRPFRFDTQQRSSTARNEALDHAKGDVIVYLDDDNRFDPDWIKGVAWAFTEYPDTQVCYGARVVDDDVRHQGLDGRSLPFVQLLPWDRNDMLRANRVDQNVIAHRPSPVRFDPSIDHFSDWDMLLQLTDDVDPLVLPVVAAHYHSDVPDRLSADFGDRAFVDEKMHYIRQRTIARRSRES
jgi:predicted AlkP superfamily phosphohydrolase/phosphomutase